MSEPTPVVEVAIAAPPDEVWRALRERDRIRHWHGWEFEGLEDEIEQIFFKETKESDDRRTLWMGAGDRFDLILEGAGTRVRITRAPLSGNPKRDAYYDQVTEGWTTFTHQLKFALEAHPGQPRRTLCFAGNGPEPEPGELVDVTPWFRSEHQCGLRVPAWGDGLLVLAHDPAKGTAMAVLTTYGLNDQALEALDTQWRAWWSAHYQGSSLDLGGG